MSDEVLEQPGRARPLRSDDEEVGEAVEVLVTPDLDVVKLPGDLVGKPHGQTWGVKCERMLGIIPQFFSSDFLFYVCCRIHFRAQKMKSWALAAS